MATQLTRGHAETAHEIIDDGKHGRLPLEMDPPGLDEAIQRNTDDQNDVEPIDMFVPVGLGHGDLGNVLFLGVIRLVPVGFGRLCHWRWL